MSYLDKKSLTRVGVYGRKDVEGESTEFSFTRFYVPMLSHYQGKSLFVDNDLFFGQTCPELIATGWHLIFKFS